LLVTQDAFLFHASILEKLWFGAKGQMLQTEEIEMALKQAGAFELYSNAKR